MGWQKLSRSLRSLILLATALEGALSQTETETHCLTMYQQRDPQAS